MAKRDSTPDSIDRHIAHWAEELPDLDPQIEGIVTRMQKLVSHLRRNRENGLAAHGLKEWEYAILHYVRATGPPYQAAPSLLAEWLGTHPATLTSRLDRMEQAGYVTRVHDPADRRRLLVALTDSGHALWQAAIGEQDRAEQELLGVLGRQDRAVLDELLRRVANALEAEGPPLMPDWPGARPELSGTRDAGGAAKSP
ncbi:MarR family winged helix-turn-helix transcriptional regulator [Actinomadura sp. HBU206391]|uniref:MarR family winged helix-turn-helix transcriptional regulator n=1 Tax=Actinomadura sp. HBU206391 TaxID=2731692 RepID=UPI001C9D33B4|nr:MarR family winged helix-turn-helix transcriptional regulator [Actinomadura sp. HBU206391]